MDLSKLRQKIAAIAESLRTEDKRVLDVRLKSLVSVFPFNEYEYALMFLMDHKVIDFRHYEELRGGYVSTNKHLGLYELAPRTFGETWAHAHIKDLDSRFVKPAKSLDPDYDGQYDLWLDGVKVEIKAARATNTKKRDSLVSKALRYDSDEPFWMNFQQIKLGVCDVFVLIGVWVDQLVYWVLSDDQVRDNRYLSHQHRGGIEYQIGITDKNIRDFDAHRIDPSEIGQRVIKKGTTK